MAGWYVKAWSLLLNVGSRFRHDPPQNRITKYSSIETAREMAATILEDTKFSKWLQSPDDIFGNIETEVSDTTKELFAVKAKLYCLAAKLLVLSYLERENPKLGVVRWIIEKSVLEDRPILKPPTLDAVNNLQELLTYQPDSPDFRKNVMLWAQNWLKPIGICLDNFVAEDIFSMRWMSYVTSLRENTLKLATLLKLDGK